MKNPQNTRARELAAQHIIQKTLESEMQGQSKFKLKRFTNVESRIPQFGKKPVKVAETVVQT